MSVDNTRGARAVLLERQRQRERYTIDHDDAHAGGELAIAAAAYALVDDNPIVATRIYPWDVLLWTPKTTRWQNLAVAGALLLAEMERLDRIPR